MKTADLQKIRLYNQRLAGPPFSRPEDTVHWLGAVQAQDYGAAKWALALRTLNCTSADVDEALAAGRILRTHILRPTWHFVSPVDIRWMLELTAPRVNALSAYYYRKTGLDDRDFTKANKVLAKSLRGGKQLTRTELNEALQKAGLSDRSNDPLRLTYMVMRAELDMVICSGALRGKQFTYALFDERVPEAEPLSRQDALGELSKRFFTGHGPATVKDFSAWSSLSLADARAGLAMVEQSLAKVTIDSEEYWGAKEMPTMIQASPRCLLLPAYDEYLLTYKSDGLVAGLERQHREEAGAGAGQTILVDGRLIGTWKRSYQKNAVIISPSYFARPTISQKRAVAEAAKRYGQFAGTSSILLDS
jgi:hypothetical protein